MTVWPLVPLGEVLVERKERIGSIDADGLPLLGVSNKEGLHRSGMPRISDMSRYLRVDREWFAYNPMRVNVGSIGWAHSEDLIGVISPDYVVFSCTPKIEPQLLYWFITSGPGLQAIKFQTAGSVRERLYFASLARVAIPLPPITEQRRIVARLEALSERINRARELQRENSTAVAALLSSMSGEAIAAAIERYGHRPLDSFAPVVTSGPRNWSEKYGQGTIRFYRAQDLGPDGRTSTKSKAYISPPENGQAKAARLIPGDVMLVITGATVGRCAVFSTADEPGYVNQHVALCRLPNGEVDPLFVRWALLSPQGQQQLLGKRYGQGKPGLNLKNIRQLTIPAAPLDEQRRIADRLESMAKRTDSLRLTHKAVSEQLGSLLPSVLNRAFSGQL